MKFTLTLRDRKGTELNEGDIVAISSHEMNFNFFAEVKYIDEKKCIAPFHTFSFHTMEKIVKLPDNAIQGKSDGMDCKYWFTHNPEKADESEEYIKDYLLSWRECERLLENSMFIIDRIQPN